LTVTITTAPIVTAPISKAAPPYPATSIGSVMQEELLRAVRSRFRRKAQALPIDDNKLVVLAVEIDSLTVVELLSALDDVLPFKVTESVVKAGGYGSIEAAVKNVVGLIETKWNKHHPGGKA
jgi:acyl carrier protein